ncbi:unnamed protein product, partial [Strongylus vulgaris]
PELVQDPAVVALAEKHKISVPVGNIRLFLVPYLDYTLAGASILGPVSRCGNSA